MTDSEFTRDWWRRVLNDDQKLTLWLQKLQRTEISGYYDHIDFMEKFPVTERERLILTNIAEDERKHSNLLIDLFAERKIEVVPNGPDSTYWEEMLQEIPSTAHYCAANYFGEALASFRFDIIVSMSETPSDIKEVICKVLPDEIFHRETLQRLAGEEILVEMKRKHDEAYAKLIGKKNGTETTNT